MALTQVNSDGMKDDSIKNADIKSDAAIAASKISGLATSATTDTTNADNIGSGTLAAARVADLAASKITSGTIATARLGSGTASSANFLRGDGTWQPAAFDDTNIRKDIAKLALQVAVDTNRAAYSLTNSFIEQFEDSTGIGSTTNTSRNDAEYITSMTAATTPSGSFTNIVANNWDDGSLNAWSAGDGTVSHGSSPDEDGMGVTAGSHANALTFGAGVPFEITAVNASVSYGIFFSIFSASLLHAGGVTGSPDNSGSDWKVGTYKNEGGIRVTGCFTLMAGTNSNYGDVYMGPNSGTSGITAFIQNNGNNNTTAQFPGTQFTITRDGDGVYELFQGDTSGTKLLNTDTTNSAGLKNASEVALAAGGTGSHACSLSQLKYRLGSAATTSATGTLESIASTADSSRTKVSGVLLYKDASGTATLGTDLKVSFSCDNGSNWTALDATSGNYTVGSPFSSGIKTAFLKEVTCTAGTAIKYKVEWANQASGSKETQLHGIGVNY